MAKKTGLGNATTVDLSRHKSKRTSIGRSSNSRPSSKSQKRGWKKYRGQG